MDKEKTVLEFSTAIADVQNDFQKFVEREDIVGKWQAAFNSLLERERNIIAKTLNLPVDALTSHFVEKLKKRSLSTDRSILDNEYERNLYIRDILTSWYSTTYIPEIAWFSKGTNHVQTLIRNDFQSPDMTEAMQVVYPKVLELISTEAKEKLVEELHISPVDLEKTFTDHLIKNKVGFSDYSSYTTENEGDPIIHTYKLTLKDLRTQYGSREGLLHFWQNLIKHLEKKSNRQVPQYASIIGGNLTINYMHDLFPRLGALDKELIPNIYTYVSQWEEIQKLKTDDKYTIILESMRDITRGTIMDTLIGKAQHVENLSLRHYDTLIGEDDGVGSNVYTEIEFRKYKAADAVKKALAGIFDLELQTNTRGPEYVWTQFVSTIAKNVAVAV